jgi:hypothetical protein
VRVWTGLELIPELIPKLIPSQACANPEPVGLFLSAV